MTEAHAAVGCLLPYSLLRVALSAQVSKMSAHARVNTYMLT